MAYYSPQDDISFVPLTPEEEVSLFKRFYSGDLSARDTLITNHLKLVAKLALQISGRGGIPDEDAISAANYGLIKALESRRFQPERGLRFATYVRKYVSGQVLTAIRERIKDSPGLEDSWVLHPADAALTGAGASMSDRSDSELRVVAISSGYVDPLNSEQDLSIVRREKLLEAIKDLPEPERLALHDHYFRGRNFADIARRRNECRALGDKKKTTREGVRKAHNRGVCKLKAALAHLEPELS